MTEIKSESLHSGFLASFFAFLEKEIEKWEKVHFFIWLCLFENILNIDSWSTLLLAIFHETDCIIQNIDLVTLVKPIYVSKRENTKPHFYP